MMAQSGIWILSPFLKSVEKKRCQSWTPSDETLDPRMSATLIHIDLDCINKR